MFAHSFTEIEKLLDYREEEVMEIVDDVTPAASNAAAAAVAAVAAAEARLAGVFGGDWADRWDVLAAGPAAYPRRAVPDTPNYNHSNLYARAHEQACKEGAYAAAHPRA